MNQWKSQIDITHPCWKGYRKLLGKLSPSSFPSPRALNGLLGLGARSEGGAAIRFVAAGEVPGVQYERHIYETGEVSTRENSWHDLFNALVWCRLPRLKTAMNSLHYQNLGLEENGRRGKIRDALTLYDESGVIVTGSNTGALHALANRDWNAAFLGHQAAWRNELQVLICGHSVLEKFLRPFKSVTAHALYLHAPEALPVPRLDIVLAVALSSGRLINSTASLSPLPLMGIPGWWRGDEQDRHFYGDRGVFRPPPARMTPVAVHPLGELDSA